MEKITSETTIKLLKTIPHSEATISYLSLIEHVLKTYVHADTPVEDRLFSAVFVVQFLRIWRQWLSENGMDMKNFVSSNTWEGLEINLILLISLCVLGETEAIHLINSQRNEKFFRKVRSFTGCESTVVNCSIKSFMHRLHLILFERRSVKKLKCDLKFPCEEGKKKRIVTHNRLTEVEMEQIISQANVAAQNETRRLGMICNSQFDVKKWFKSVRGIAVNNSNESQSQNNFLNINDDNLSDSESETESESEEHQRENSNIDNLDFEIVDSTDAFLPLKNGQKIHKSSFVWNQQHDRINISSDIRRRFMAKNSITITSNDKNSSPVWKGELMSKGDYVIINSNERMLFGCVLNFKNLNGSSKSDSTFSHDHVNINSNVEVGVLLDPVFEIINDQKNLTSELHSYHPIKTNYIAHCNADIDFSDRTVRRLMRNL